VGKFSVIYDACVLYPAPLRDCLMRLALTDLFKARWSDQIHEEWINALLPGIAQSAFGAEESGDVRFRIPCVTAEAVTAASGVQAARVHRVSLDQGFACKA